ncbi:PP2C family protein-serine/threonine phosphatase [Streptomyces scopuliridis]|uniref:PP2C family protein-serine/threonine phosphatase n=1 Tax=Streptomyces scopuliridis TaxID=452529 RepID=UPI00068F77A8|nr:PP2C family protein-serine/threonine phosphatase [Streptomyces scopuliridis]
MGTTGSATSSRLLRRPSVKLAVALVCLAGLLGFDLLTSPNIRIGGLMVAVPALSATFLAPGEVLFVVLLTLLSVAVAAISNDTLGTEAFPVSFATVALISVASVVTASVRQRRERELAQSRWVATVMQDLLLRPLPRRLGPLSISSVYIAAEEEANIGGDVYAAAVTPGSVRVMVGDVQGKGLGAVEVVAYLLSAFRQAARNGTALAELPDFLDRSLRDELVDVQATSDDAPDSVSRRRALEGFVTAVIVEFREGEDVVRIANRGHPPPLLIRQDKVLPLDPMESALPLGLGDLGAGEHHVDTYELAVGDRLLLYTDGVIEARDATGRFYPLADRVARWTDRDSDEVLQAIQSDMLRHVGARPTDDVAMVAVQRMV